MKTLIHNYNIRVRYADTDKMGIVYNGNYLTYFEIGRTELMRAHGLPYTEFEKAGYYLPVVEAQVKYLNTAAYDDELIIEASLELQISPRVTFSYRILKGEDIITVGKTIHTFVNSQTLKPTRPPKFYIDAIKAAAE